MSGEKPTTAPPENIVEVFRRAIMFHVQNVHTAFPARVLAVKGKRVQLQPSLRRLWADGQEEALPVLNGVPVAWTRAGNARMTMKITKGDLGMVICSERALDSWLVGSGQEVTPKQARSHSLSDGVFFPGLCPDSMATGGDKDAEFIAGNAGLYFDGGNGRLYAGAARLNMTGGKVALGAGGVEVLDILSQALTLLGASLTTAPGSPIMSQAAYAALAAQLNSIKGAL